MRHNFPEDSRNRGVPRRYSLFKHNNRTYLTIPSFCHDDLDGWRSGTRVVMEVAQPTFPEVSPSLWITASSAGSIILKEIGRTLAVEVPEYLLQQLGWTFKDSLKTRPTYADGVKVTLLEERVDLGSRPTKKVISLPADGLRQLLLEANPTLDLTYLQKISIFSGGNYHEVGLDLQLLLEFSPNLKKD